MTPEQYMQICDHMRQCVRGTRWWGRVYAVGGCNRDLLMGTEIHDVDFAVETPDGGIRLGYALASRGMVDGRVKMFRRYGTSMLRLKAFPEHDIEIVQTRSGSYPLDHVEKSKKYFGTLAEDARRRDLTVNTLYYDVCRRSMLDPTGCGHADLEAHRLRTPADPDVTMADDPLRVLRMVRFSLRLGWPITPELWGAMERHAGELELLKPERVAIELEKIHMLGHDRQAAEMLRRLGIDNVNAHSEG